MWLEDLQKIEYWINDVPAHKPISIKIKAKGSQYDVDKLEDLEKENIERIDHIRFIHGDGLIQVDLGPSAWSNSITSTSDEFKVEASRNQIELLLKKHQRMRFFNLFYGTPRRSFTTGSILLTLFAFTIVANSANWLGAGGKLNSPSSAIGLALGLVVMGSIMLLLDPTASLLYAKTRNTLPTLWERKRDDIKITIVSNVIALIVGGAIGYVIGKIP